MVGGRLEKFRLCDTAHLLLGMILIDWRMDQRCASATRRQGR